MSNTLMIQSENPSALMLDAGNRNAMIEFARAMSEATIAVPAHFRNKPGDCLAVTMQAMQWGMNPFAVAQKTHVVNGTLGYEAQLVNAVVSASGMIDRFRYEYRGDGAQIECRVGAVLAGETQITWGEWLSASTVTTKNSPLWKTNPKQQLGYLQVKNWARLYAPGAILGIYTTDELAQPIDMGQAERVDAPAEQAAPAIPDYSAEQFAANVDTWREAIASKKKTPADLIAIISTKYRLSDAQREAILDLEQPAPEPEQNDAWTNAYTEAESA